MFGGTEEDVRPSFMWSATADASVIIGVVSVCFALVCVPQGEAAFDVSFDLTRGNMMKCSFQKFPCNGIKLSR